MSRIGISLQRTAKSLRKTIAPGVGDDIIEVWRGRTGTEPVPGGALRDALGRTVRTNGEEVKVSTGIEKVAAYYGRFGHTRGGTEMQSGPTVELATFVFSFNVDDNPDIRGEDQLIVAVKRDLRQKIADLGWQPLNAYSVGGREQPTVSNGLSYIWISGTQSGTFEPGWPVAKGETVADGDGVWLCDGPLPVYGVVDPGGPGTVAVTYVVSAERK